MKDEPGKKNKLLGVGKKRLACSSCRRRRKKCNLEYPCSNCFRLKLICNVNEEDLRKKRHSSSYVNSLESHIAYLENNFKNLVDKVFPNGDNPFNKNAAISNIVSNFSQNQDNSVDNSFPLNGENMENMLEFNPPISTSNSADKLFSLEKSSGGGVENNNPVRSNSTGSLVDKLNVNKKRRTFVKGSLYPEGPVNYKAKVNSNTVPISSLVSNDSLASSTGSFGFSPGVDMNSTVRERIADLKTTVIVRSMDIKHANLINNDPRILNALSSFYKWLYPGLFIFVHRESFLYGFFNHAEDNYGNSHYCSTELVYAMCAIGSRLTPDLQDVSEIYYQKAKDTLLKLVFDEQSVACITTVQAFLCLAFYELGKGNNQLAWYFSGLAIRVGYDMGFQLDPEVWYTDDTRMNLTKSELEIRSRIYWGCYVADHFICLMLGRTSTLSVSNSTIPESDELPEVNGTEEFRFASKHVLQVSLPLRNLIILSRIVQVFTSKIFIETEETEEKVAYLINFNSQVGNWRQSLPDLLKWSKDLLKDEDFSTDPTLSYFWYYYYIVRLTFNKPFIEDCDEAVVGVLEVLEDLKILFDNFKNKFGSYHKATLYQLFACLLVVKCLKRLKELPKDSRRFENWDFEKELSFFMNIFHQQLSPGFELPKRLYEDSEYEIEQEKQAMNQVSNINYTHDFSLSNEIDDLIKDLFDIGYENNKDIKLPL